MESWKVEDAVHENPVIRSELLEFKAFEFQIAILLTEWTTKNTT